MSDQKPPFRPNRPFRAERRNDTDSSPGDLIFGLRPLIEAVRAGKEMDKVLVQKGLKGEIFHELRTLLHDFQIPYQIVPIEKLDRITRGNHQGVIAFGSPISFSDIDSIISEIFNRGRVPKLLMLDEVTDVRNFGAICRTVECQGFDAVIIPEKGSAAINADAVKTSAGALLHLAVCRVKSLKAVSKSLQESGIKLLAASEKGEKNLAGIDMTIPVCVIMGSEERGVHPDIIKIADYLVQIPMFGKTSSMNVSVAAGIFMYEVNRQRIGLKY